MNKTSQKNIRMFAPYVSERAIERVCSTLRSGYIGEGPVVAEFEEAFKNQLNAPYALGVTSGTTALHLALTVAGVGPNDEVITSAQTMMATSHAILAHYAKPVFADVQYLTGNMNPSDIEHRITKKTKAILAVHWAGYPCDLEEIHAVASKFDLPVIEDAAHALGATYKGQTIGSISPFTCFSFQAIKHITTGDGGMMCFTEKDNFDKARRRRWYGIDRIKRAPSILGEPIFDVYNIEGDISGALKRKVWLKSGGYLLIEQTEALVAIDVNTGRYVGKHNLEETILNTNLEAVKEIAYQIRLRDIGGLIIIDFIDMDKKSNQEKVYLALNDAFKKDRSKTNVLPISEMGLVQMTRKRIRKPLNRLLCEPCFYCEGEGYLISKKSVCYNIYREINREAQETQGTKLTVRVNPENAELLHGEESHIIYSLEKRTGKQIVIYPASQFHLEEYDIFEMING